MPDPATQKGTPLGVWLGREAIASDTIAPGPVRGLVSTISSQDIEPAVDDPAPLLAHWLYFLPYSPLNEVGPDGHPRRGGFLPPVDLPRRMWAGGRLEFVHPLRIGAKVTRRSRIAEIDEKHGRSGPLVFVGVDHEIVGSEGVVLRERHDIVYRDMPAPDAPAPAPRPAPENPGWERRIDPDPVLLFRYSALTFNGHRIHYDRPYVTEVEGYPGLIVHGPLIATLLLHEYLARHPGADVARFAFRAVKAVYDTGPFFVGGSIGDGGVAELFARDEGGALCMQATATLR